MRKVSGAPFFVVVSVCFRGSESQRDEISFFVSVSLFFRARKRETEERPRWLVLNERRGRERETSAAFASVKDTFLSFIDLLLYTPLERETERERERDPEKRVLIH